MDNMPNIRMIKGLVATLVGLVLIVLSWGVILRMLLFCCGAFLLYHGVRMLDVQAFRTLTDTVKYYVNKLMGE